MASRGDEPVVESSLIVAIIVAIVVVVTGCSLAIYLYYLVSMIVSYVNQQIIKCLSRWTPPRQPEVELTHAFEEVAPSASTSGRSTMPVKKLPYDVFINHRGPDVKQTLAATLYNTFTGMGLRVFLDSEELELGDFLPTEIEDAMRSASLHIAVFSQNYAQSPWCLAELSFMLKTGNQIVPVFYHVQPNDVRYAKGVYADAFSRHKKKGRYSSEKLQEWKNALNNVSYNIGHIINNKDDLGRMLKNIANCVLKVIKNVPFVVAKNPIALDEIIVEFESTALQSTESHHTVQFVGIWGMGGSGKTTLAKQLYNNKYTTMERSSFLVDVRYAASKSSLHMKQKKLLEDLGLHGLSVENIEEGKGILASRLRSVRVLIVLDDVDNVDQLEALVPEKDSLGRGSLIIVTTREREVLRCWGISSIYKMKALDSHHAKQLFCWHAFMHPDPLQEFEDLVEKFLKVCNGLPLSLKVFGAQLYNISNKDYWEAQLNKLSRILDKDIMGRLKISYVALDEEEKHIFLDSACFFIGEKRTSAIAAWDGLGWNGMHSWERLLNKCLVELDDDDCIRMHDHLRDMGREIASQQSPCRLWSPQQIINADNEAQRIGIRGIMATRAGSRSEVEFPRCSQGGELIVNTSRGDCSLPPNLLGLKFFQVRGNYYNQIIGDKLGELVWLRWFDHGQRNLRSLSSMKNLRVLELNEEVGKEQHLEELWETDDDGPVQLKELVISGCSKFQGFPKSIGCLRDLKIIVLDGLYELYNKIRSLPESFCFLQSLEHLSLPGCAGLSSLPSSFGDLRNLRHLDLSGCGELRSLPESFCFLQSLEHLTLSWCKELSSLPSSFGDLRNLRHLDLSRCGELRSLPESFCFLQSLEHLTLSWCKELSSLPSSFGDLRNLRDLDLSGCPKLDALPNFAQLASLQCFGLEGCYGVEKIQGLEHCTSLETLTAQTRWEEAGTESLERMERLKRLELIAINRSAVEGCIPSMQKWPEEMCVCTRAVPDSGSLIDSVVFTNLSVIDSISNQKIINYDRASLKSSSNDHCILLYFVVNCNSPQFNLMVEDENAWIRCTVEEGKWVWFGVFTQRSNWHNSKSFGIGHCYWQTQCEGEVEVERGMVVVGEEERVAEAFRSLWALLSK